MALGVGPHSNMWMANLKAREQSEKKEGDTGRSKATHFSVRINTWMVTCDFHVSSRFKIDVKIWRRLGVAI